MANLLRSAPPARDDMMNNNERSSPPPLCSTPPDDDGEPPPDLRRTPIQRKDRSSCQKPSDGVSIASSARPSAFCCASAGSDNVNIASDQRNALLQLCRRLPFGLGVNDETSVSLVQ